MCKWEPPSHAILRWHSKKDSRRSCYLAHVCQVAKPLCFEQGLRRLCLEECPIQLPEAPRQSLCFSRASWEGWCLGRDTSTVSVTHAHLGKAETTSKPGINYLSSRRALLGKTWPWTTQEEAVNKRCLGATAGKPASSTGHTGLGGHDPHITGSGCDQTQMGELQQPPLLREKKCWRSDKDGSSPLRYPW